VCDLSICPTFTAEMYNLPRMSQIRAIPRWLWAVLTSWYGWVGGSSTAGLVGLGQSAGWWNPTPRNYLWLIAAGFVISMFQAWYRENEACEREKARNAKPEIVGRVLVAVLGFFGESTEQGIRTPNCSIAMKLSLTNKTSVDATLRDAELIVEVKGHKYVGQRLPAAGFFQYSDGFGAKSEKMNDLISSITYNNPIRYRLASEGWLDFLIEGLDVSNSKEPLRTKMTITLIDELGEKHIIKADDVSVRR
jgi:hypothetical protein